MFSSAAVADEAVSEINDNIEAIEVRGIYSSLREAAMLKRSDDRIVDAIVAEDIGKLPDNNIAEALQRVTGVSINRDFGVGSEVSIRGLPQNRVEINGRSTLGDGRNGVNFQDFPSSFLSAVEVIKSPTPEMIEGALGGTISLKTARPLTLSEPLFAASIDAEYADKADHWAPILNASAGDNWDLGDAGTFGALAMISYQDRELRRDESLLQLQVGAVDLDGDGNADPAQNSASGNYIYGREHTFNPRTESRERTAYNLSLQWEPQSGDGNIYLDLSKTERQGWQEAFSILHVSGTPRQSDATFEDSNGQLQNFIYDSVLPLQTAASEFRNTDSYSHALGGEWTLTDKLLISAEYSFAKSESYQPKSEFRFRGIEQALEFADPAETNQWYVPVFFFNGQDRAPTVDFFEDGYVFTNQQNQAFRRYEDTRTFTDNEEDAYRFDLQYDEPFGIEWIGNIKTGVRFTNRDYQRQQKQFRLTNIYRYLEDGDGNPDIIFMEDIASQFPGAIVDYAWDDAFDNSGRSGIYHLNRISAFNVSLLRDQQATFDIVKQLLAGSNYEVAGDLADNLAYQQGAYSTISEDTKAFYFQTHLDFDSVRAVLGARWVETEITAGAYQEGVIVTDTQKYDDWLPSLNVTWEVVDNTLLRFAAGKVMRRADFDELSPAYNFQDAYTTATRGNPGLEPYRATQYDVSVEHYFGKGNVLTAALFYKDVESFLRSDSYCADLPDIVRNQTNRDDFEKICIRPTERGDSDNWTYATDPDSQIDFMGIETTTRTNGESGKVQGLELGYQQQFDFLPGAFSGLGLSANYTYADSEDPDGVPLEDISKNTYNLQGYWEYGAVSLRLAYTFRDRFLDDYDTKRVRPLGQSIGADADDPTAGNAYREDLQQLDFSSSFDVNEHLTLVANVSNITGEATINSGVTGTGYQILESDRRYTLGLRVKF
ncbi:TonB-dependent receptor [Ferrimonas senticii]|uniref:TonB-dependent receptor n=1 Tax=Ferrimonas senticii TaxID=394566 RepID=UPI001969F810|nr:TonB-dependent receptor [Ferrimonas senticii]